MQTPSSQTKNAQKMNRNTPEKYIKKYIGKFPYHVNKFWHVRAVIRLFLRAVPSPPAPPRNQEKHDSVRIRFKMIVCRWSE